MSLIILMVVCIAYIGLALLVAVAIFKFTRKISWPLLAFVVLLILPVHEGVFGYPTFREFDEHHRGTPIPKPHYAEGFLVEGRRASSPIAALKADTAPGTFRYKEFPREMVESMQPSPRDPLAAFVQFFLTTTEDPACTQPLDAAGSQANCVGVTSSATPRSRFAVFEEPDIREGRFVLQLNESKLFPVVGAHSRVREIESNRVVAEVWQFALRSKVYPLFAWFQKQNPPGRSNAALCLTSVPQSAQQE